MHGKLLARVLRKPQVTLLNLTCSDGFPAKQSNHMLKWCQIPSIASWWKVADGLGQQGVLGKDSHFERPRWLRGTHQNNFLLFLPWYALVTTPTMVADIGLAGHVGGGYRSPLFFAWWSGGGELYALRKRCSSNDIFFRAVCLANMVTFRDDVPRRFATTFSFSPVSCHSRQNLQGNGVWKLWQQELIWLPRGNSQLPSNFRPKWKVVVWIFYFQCDFLDAVLRGSCFILLLEMPVWR